MEEYLLIHRGDEIYRLHFKLNAHDRLVLEPHDNTTFAPIQGWEAERVKAWLTERGFEYYWEGYND